MSSSNDTGTERPPPAGTWVDLFAGYTKYIWGRDTHNGQAFTFGTTWYFER